MTGRTPSSSNPVRWGILGLPGSTQRMIAALQAVPNASLVAVATQHTGAMDALLSRHPALRIHHNYDALLEDPEIEAVYIPLPNTFHAKWAVRAAAQGKHILCEKPLATTLPSVEHMIDAAQRQQVLLMEAFMWRFHPQHARVRALVADGAIGRPRVLHIGLSFTVDTRAPTIRLNPALGGGATWDIGCYAVSIARFLFEAEPQAIRATASFDPATNADLAIAALLTFAGDRVALFDAGMNYVPRGEYEIIGTTGRLRVDRFWIEPDAPARLVLRDASGHETVEVIPPANHFALEIEHFSAAIRGEVSLQYGADDALAQIRALTAMQRAFHSGQAECP